MEIFFSNDFYIEMNKLLQSLQEIHKGWSFSFSIYIDRWNQENFYLFIIRATNFEGSFVNFTDCVNKKIDELLSEKTIKDIYEWFSDLNNCKTHNSLQ